MEILFLDDAVKKGLKKIVIFKQIEKLEKKFFPEYPYNFKDIKNAYQKSNGSTLLLFDKNKIVGYLIPLLFKNKDYLQILTIAVDKNHQKKGYGTKLIKKCEEIADSLKLKRVIIRADVSYPILRILKNLEYLPMKAKEIDEFRKERLFNSKDKIKKANFENLNLSQVYIITKDIGKKNPYSFIPMIKNLD